MSINPTGGPQFIPPRGNSNQPFEIHTLDSAVEASEMSATALAHLRCEGNPFIGEGFANERKIPAEIDKLKGEFGRRTLFHLLRLTSPYRTEIERNFGMAFIRSAQEALETINENPILKDGPFGIIEKIKGIQSDESADTSMLWTLSPYLYKALREKNFSESESLKRIFVWQIDGFGLSTRASDEEMFSPFKVNLKGLEHLNIGRNSRTYYLTEDPNDASHKYSEQIANELVEIYLSRLDWAATQCAYENIKW